MSTGDGPGSAVAVGSRPRVVIVGAGFGGMAAARVLGRAAADVVVVDRDNYHGFWPLLYQVATAGLDAQDIALPVRRSLSRLPGVEVRLGVVERVDTERRLVCLAGDAAPVEYDYLVLAAGSVTATYGVDGVAENSFPLKTIPDAVRLRNHLITRFEQLDADPASARDGDLDVVVAGGGPTGVELAGALSELIGADLARDFPHLDLAHAKIHLVEMTDELLGGFSSASRKRARRDLVARGVDVKLGVAIRRIADGHVEFADGTSLAAGTVVWAAGVRPNPLAAALDLPLSKRGGIVVSDDLSVPGHPEVFAIGDLATAIDPHGRPYPQLASVAIQQGRYVARVIERRIDGRIAGKPAPRFHYLNRGIMATIGRRAAVADLPLGVHLGGSLGWFSWLGVHLVFLMDTRRRALVLLKWAWNYITWEHGSRAIVSEDARTPPGPRQA
jgi:NADH:ubiquinone reductase (H+-translocating)